MKARAHTCLESLTKRLLDEAADGKGWEGRLSSSALATAVASGALLSFERQQDQNSEELCQQAGRGLSWLKTHQNADGGWGDSPESPSNLATTLLVLAAFRIGQENPCAVKRGMDWLERRCGGTDPADWRKAVLEFYAEDHTFSVPILSFCTACGLLDSPGETPWHQVPQLPFEFSCAPPGCFRLLRLQVVSYALPALISIGLLRHRMAPGLLPLAWLRNRLTAPALRLLQRIQPEKGGFLEAAPLTGFVLLSLSEAGLADHPVATKSMEFLTSHQRADGSWPIDTHLAGWLTSLAIDALPESAWSASFRSSCLSLLLERQTREIHPYTRSAPGGWSWTPRSGGVPDGDDTAAALKALFRLDPEKKETLDAAEKGCLWLVGLQNRDGGIPTFCRGWGKLPFDQSCPDITAHALRAWRLWGPFLDPAAARRLHRAEQHALRYLGRTQQADGSWHPLWFGNQAHPAHRNPVFGTAQVLAALAELPSELLPDARTAAMRYLIQAQHDDGSWGGDKGLTPTIEETALALRALVELDNPEAQLSADRAVTWLITHIESQQGDLPSTPIGLYFASLWYDETLYPVLFATDALTHWLQAKNRP